MWQETRIAPAIVYGRTGPVTQETTSTLLAPDKVSYRGDMLRTFISLHGKAISSRHVSGLLSRIPVLVAIYLQTLKTAETYEGPNHNNMNV